MKMQVCGMKKRVHGAAVCGLLAMTGAAGAQVVGTGFTYQGKLIEAGSASTGTFDLRFRLFDAASLGGQIGATLCADNVTVADGLFTVELDFGDQFSADDARFLEIDVRADTGATCANSAGFLTLGPRQALTATPFATRALSARTANQATSADDAARLNGQAASFYQNAANLTSGTLSDTRLSATIPRLNFNATWSATPTFNGGTATTPPFNVDSPFLVTNLNADLLDGLSASAFALLEHTHDAGQIVSGVLADARIPAGIARLANSDAYTGVPAFNGGTSGSVAPFTVDSTLVVTNLNADLFDGFTSSAFARLGVSNTWAGTNTYSGIVNFDSVVNADSNLQVLGNAGFGGAPNANRVHIAGNADVTGTLTVGSLAITPVERVVSLSAFDYTNTSATVIGPATPYIGNGSQVSATSAIAPLHLPDGATISRMEVQLLDDDGNENVTVLLLRRGTDGTVGGTMASVTSSGNSTVIRAASDGSISAPVVDNDGFVYLVQVNFPAVIPLVSMRVYSVKVFYLVSQPLP